MYYEVTRQERFTDRADVYYLEVCVWRGGLTEKQSGAEPECESFVIHRSPSYMTVPVDDQGRLKTTDDRWLELDLETGDWIGATAEEQADHSLIPWDRTLRLRNLREEFVAVIERTLKHVRDKETFMPFSKDPRVLRKPRSTIRMAAVEREL